jgi:ribosomal protein L32
LIIHTDEGEYAMAFLNKVGEVVGKASQGLSDTAQTVSSAAQETKDSLARERQEQRAMKDAKRQEEKARVAEQLKKCPQCGQQLSGISAICSLCGYEIRNAKTVSSVAKLTKEINKLNQKRNTVTDAIASKLSGRDSKPTDEKIASLINNFIVPNSKEDIFEFMILAAGYMDAKFLAGKKKVSDVADIVIKAWATKFEQTFQKAKFSFGQDSDFEKVQSLYDQKMQEIEESKSFAFFRRK